MASLTDESLSSQFSSPRTLGDPLTSPGPLHMSDLGPRTASPHSRPHRLQPLRHDSVGTRATKTKRKKTKKKDGEETERGKLEGSERGPEEISELASHSDPLLEASTLQQMQARLDPLFGGTPPPALQNVDHRSTTTISSGSESLPTRGKVDERRATQRRRRRRRSQRAAEEEGREEGEGRAEKSHHKKKRRTRRESGSGMSESAQLEASDEQDRVEEGEGFSAVVDDENSLTLPETFQGLPAPPYYPPPEEIQDEGMEGGGERVVEGAPPPLPSSLTHQHTGPSPDVVYVERTDGRGFNVRHKVSNSSVVPDGMKSGRMMEKEISSEQFALYSHRLVQKVALTAHGLIAGLSLWDCVVCNVIGSLSGGHLTLLRSYHPLSLPGHSLYLLLLSLVLLTLLDRLDMAKLGKQCWQSTLHSLPGLALLSATVLTVLALVVSLSVAAIDDRISLYPDQPSLWPDIVTPFNLTSITNSTPPFLTTHTQDDIVYIPADNDPMTSRLRLWLGLSVFRSICCVLGWGLLVCASDHDRIEEYILSMVDSSSGQQQLRGPSGSPDITTGDQNPTNAAQTSTTTAMHIATTRVNNQTPVPL